MLLLLSFALAITLALGAPGAIPAPTPHSQLPTTVPGLTREEGVFLVTSADDGSRATYFIAQNTRHSIGSGDLQVEQQLNPLWPVRFATREDVLAFVEAAPIGGARSGLITAPVAAPDEAAADPLVSEPLPSPAAAGTPEPAVPEPAMPAPAMSVPAMPAPSGMPAPSAMPHAPLSEPIPPTPSLHLPPAAAEPILYVLQPGDNLIRIAARYGTTVDSILASNGIANPDRIYAGEPLLIPRAPADVVEPSTSPAPVAADLQPVVADSPSTEPDTLAGRSEGATYTVKRGDSAITIARQLGVGVDELLAANGVVNRNRVYIGQVLDIPGA